MEEAIEHLIQVLDDKKKRTVNGCTRTLAHKVKSAFVSIKRELQGRKTQQHPERVVPDARRDSLEEPPPKHGKEERALPAFDR